MMKKVIAMDFFGVNHMSTKLLLISNKQMDESHTWGMLTFHVMSQPRRSTDGHTRIGVRKAKLHAR